MTKQETFWFAEMVNETEPGLIEHQIDPFEPAEDTLQLPLPLFQDAWDKIVQDKINEQHPEINKK